MKYKIEDDAKDLMIQMDAKLNLMEVKGDSVEHLFYVRKMLKQMFDSLEEIKEEEKEMEG